MKLSLDYIKKIEYIVNKKNQIPNVVIFILLTFS